MKRLVYLCVSMLLPFIACSCSDDETVKDPLPEPLPGDATLRVEPAQFGEVPAAGATLDLSVTTTAGAWHIRGAAGNGWARPTISAGVAGTTRTAIFVEPNEGEARTAELIVSALGCDDVRIAIRQAAFVGSQPDYADPDRMPDAVEPTQEGMPSDARTLARRLHAGINIGNTLEACNNNGGSADPATWTGSETMWGNPLVTPELIAAYKAAGFNAVRIPVAWVAGHLSDVATCKIDLAWLARVKEVVDYCYAAGDMYVLINIHWDGGWLENNPVKSKQEEVNRMQQRLWTQIAKYFRDYDEHLLFAGTNEVHANYNRPTQEQVEVQQSYNQTFVDAVRATGGRNAYRVLVTQTYNTNVDHGRDFHVMSQDPTPGRQMLEVHCYTPWDFCGDDAKTASWGTDEDIRTLEREFKQLGKFYDAGYPLLLGEYGALYNKALVEGNASYMDNRCNWVYHATKFAKENGYAPFVWDTGSDIFDRRAASVLPHQQGYLDALMRGAEEGKYPD